MAGCASASARGDSSAARLYLVVRQRARNNFLAFGDEPIDAAQLLAMTIEAADLEGSQQRYQVFVSFFKKRLSADGGENDGGNNTARWEGFGLTLESVAKAFCIDSGVKYIGRRGPQIDSIEVADTSSDSAPSEKNCRS
jgi:hypothetical protein